MTITTETRISANETKLRRAVNGVFTDTEDSIIPLLMEVPELGATPEKIDVTTLSDKSKRYIPGIKDYGDLVFKFLYQSTADGNFQLLKGFEDDGTAVDFRIEYPDRTTHTFSAIPAVKMDAGAINGALTFSATMMLQSDIDFGQLPSA